MTKLMNIRKKLFYYTSISYYIYFIASVSLFLRGTIVHVSKIVIFFSLHVLHLSLHYKNL